jgi:hypothetical protein
MFSPKTMRETRQERSECAYSNINLFVYLNVREERGEKRLKVKFIGGNLSPLVSLIVILLASN